MKCYIYRSSRREELYLFVPEPDRFEQVPKPLMASFGRPGFVMELDLTPERRLARSDPGEVIQHLSEQGFHLQMPPPPDLGSACRQKE